MFGYYLIHKKLTSRFSLQIVASTVIYILLVADCLMFQCCIIRQSETLGVFPYLNGTIYDVENR